MKRFRPRPGNLLRCIKSCTVWPDIDTSLPIAGVDLYRDDIVLYLKKRNGSYIILYQNQRYQTPLRAKGKPGFLTECFEKIEINGKA